MCYTYILVYNRIRVNENLSFLRGSKVCKVQKQMQLLSCGKLSCCIFKHFHSFISRRSSILLSNILFLNLHRVTNRNIIQDVKGTTGSLFNRKQVMRMLRRCREIQQTVLTITPEHFHLALIQCYIILKGLHG